MILDPLKRGGTKPRDLPKIAGALQQASLPAGALAICRMALSQARSNGDI